MARFKVYTKTGDKGTTALIGGNRVSKADDRIEAYGTVDELISHIGLIRDLSEDSFVKEILLNVQDKLMVVASILATDCIDCPKKIPNLFPEDIIHLEDLIDKFDLEIPELKSFILPGGHPIISNCHIARTICRRAERRSIILENKVLNLDIVIKYLNRLSDFLFTLARKLSYDLKVDEIQWLPKL